MPELQNTSKKTTPFNQFVIFVCIMAVGIGLIGIHRMSYDPCKDKLIFTGYNFKSVQQALKKPLDACELFLRNQGLSSVPSEIKKLKNLRILELSGNKLTMLPREIGKLKKLQTLTVRANNLSSIPPEIGNLKNLISLDISDNDISKLPREIGNLDKLISLNVHGNQLTDVPAEIARLVNLESLDLRNNTIGTVPSEFINLKNLTTLDMYGNGTVKLPNTLASLVSLTSITTDDIRVEDPPNECMEMKTVSQRTECLLPYFQYITKLVSGGHAITKAQEIFESGAIPDCHFISHEIGYALVERFNSNIGQAFSACTMGCNEGCYHGVIESAIATNDSSPEEILEDLMNICNNESFDNIIRRQCIHGLGHGFFAHGYLTLNEALAQCQKFELSFDSEICVGGVFMEYMDNYVLLSENYLRKQIPDMCSAKNGLTNDKIIYACISSLGQGITYFNDYNLEKSYDMCELLVNPLYSNSCKDRVKTAIDRGVDPL